MSEGFARWLVTSWFKIKRLLFNPFVLAVIPALVVIFLLPDLFRKYQIKEVAHAFFRAKNLPEYHVDLNGDGDYERIQSYWSTGNNALSLWLNEGYEGFKGQYLFERYFYPKEPELFFHDIESDGLMEVFGFTVNEDSVFLNWITPYAEGDTPESRYVCSIDRIPGTEYDWRCESFNEVDLYGDGKKEVVFTIHAGRSLQPRAIFVYDPVSDTVLSSDSYGSPCINLGFADIDSDGASEIIASTASPSNLDSTKTRYDDYRTWLKVYSADLSLFMEPIPFTVAEGNGLYCDFIWMDKQPVIVALHNSVHMGDTSSIQLIDTTGVVLKSAHLPIVGVPCSYFGKTEQEIIVQSGYHHFMVFSKELELLELYELPFSGRYKMHDDINEDGCEEYLLQSPNRTSVIICADEFEDYYQLDFEDAIINVGKCGAGRFFVHTNEESFLYSFNRNLGRYWQFPMYIGIYLFLVLLIWGIKRLQQIQMQERMMLEGEVRKLQLTSIKNQMDPHFTFNALNVVSGLSQEGQLEKVDSFVMKFSRLLRKQLETSDLTQVTLQDELEFVNNYMEMQKIRYEKELSLICHVEEELLLFMIPKMLIHTHVENAIKHGLLPRGDGVINVGVKSHAAGAIITIQDNGVGREAASKMQTHGNGTGLKVLDEIFRMYYQLYRVRIRQEITDLYDDEGKPAGTLVTLVIPKTTR